MQIRLEVYLTFRGERIYKGQEEVPDQITPEQLLRHLQLDHHAELAVLVDGRYHPEDQPIPPGAEVAILRRSEGGSGSKTGGA